MTRDLLAAVTPLKASRWETLKATWLGKKVVSENGDCTITMYQWRGTFYVTDVKYADNSRK